MSRAYRIGYLNPFLEKAENQALASLSEAARRLGHQMIGMAHSDDILAERPDFVISVATAQPKLTEIPTFGAIHEPKVRLCGEELLFRHLLSYDGYLTISETLVDFLESLNAGFQREEAVGFYYNTPQVAEIHTDLPAVVAADALQLCYFGTNWDRRARPLLRALALKPYMRIHGPRDAWSYLAGSPSFKGPTPFDGVSVQQTYARHGAGLVVLSREHRLDDIISNRIFEITSVGAVAICPDMPWIKANFADTVSYYSSDRPVTFNLGEIDAILDAIKADPAAAAARARAAREIFETRFAAERMIESAVRYFEGWQARPAPAGPAEPVDVILRLNGASDAERLATLASLQAQATGRIRLITAGEGARADGLTGGAVIEAAAAASGPDPAEALKAGLALVKNPLFAVVEAGDVWTHHHMAEALTALGRAGPDTLVFSCVADAGDPAAPVEGERRSLRARPDSDAALIDSLAGLGLEGMMAPSALLPRINLPALMSGPQADAVLIGLLLEQATPVYTHRPTTIARRRNSQDEGAPPAYGEADNVTALLRLGPQAMVAESRLPDPLTDYWRTLSAAVHEELKVKEAAEVGEEEANAIEGGSPVPSIHERADLVTKPIVLDGANLWGQGGTEMAQGEFGPSVNVGMPAPHAYCASINLRDELFDGPQWLIAEFADIEVPFRVGVVNRTTEEMLELDTVPMIKDHMEVWIRIEQPIPASYIIMAGDTVQEAKLRLVGLWLAKYPDAPADA